MDCIQTRPRFFLLAMPALLIATLCLITPSDLHGTEVDAQESWRDVRLQEQRLTLQVPFHWRLMVNERAREGEAILSAQDVGASGQLLPTSVNLRFATREEGNEYPLPDPEAYANVLLATLRSNQSIDNIQLIEAITVERSGLQGTLVDYTFQVQGIEARSRSLNLIASNPPRRYILSYGTVDALWGDDVDLLEEVVSRMTVE